MKKILALLSFLIPFTALAQNQGDPAPLGTSNKQVFCIVNETLTDIADAGDLNYVACSSAGQILSSLSTSGLATDPIKAEDSAHSTGHAGIFILGVADDNTATPTSSTAGDYVSPAIAATTGAFQISVINAFQSDAATGLLKLEDAAHTTGDAGVAMFGFADDNTPSPTAGAAGDYILPAVSSLTGAIQVSLIHAFQSSAGGSPIKLEDAAFSDQDAVMMAGMQRQDTPAAGGADLDIQPLKGNSVGALYGEPANQAGTFARAEMAAASITGSYTTLLTNSAKLKFCRFRNQTDVSVSISFDATNDDLSFIAAGATEFVDFGANGRWMASNISIMEETNATTGSFFVNCWS